MVKSNGQAIRSPDWAEHHRGRPTAPRGGRAEPRTACGGTIAAPPARTPPALGSSSVSLIGDAQQVFDPRRQVFAQPDSSSLWHTSATSSIISRPPPLSRVLSSIPAFRTASPSTDRGLAWIIHGDRVRDGSEVGWAAGRGGAWGAIGRVCGLTGAGSVGARCPADQGGSLAARPASSTQLCWWG